MVKGCQSVFFSHLLLLRNMQNILILQSFQNCVYSMGQFEQHIKMLLLFNDMTGKRLIENINHQFKISVQEI